LLTGLAAISVNCWPWESAVALKEVGEAMTQYHIVNNWLWLGAVDDLNDAATLLRTPAGFDHDGYKILCKPVLAGKFEIIVLNDPAAT
ncbi:endonuclease, partial [Enterobacter asburiae]